MLWDGSVSATLQKTGNEQAELVVKTGNEQAEEHAKQGKKEARVPFQIYVTPPQTPPSTPTQTPPSTPGASSSTAHGADSASHAERGTNDASAGPQAQRQLVLTADVPPTPSMRKRMGGGS
ncbi:unnamed protein product [Amoebophrya sp. A120]|nr:unnamed protein product [Amoebophrya sp. A120]|eukprot:GSA120T00014474001.1